MRTIDDPQAAIATPGGDDLYGARLLLVDMRVRTLLMREARRRLVTGMFGIPRADQTLLASIVLLGAAAGVVGGIVARPMPRASGADAAIGASLVNTALGSIAGPSAATVPFAGALIGLAVVSHALRPVVMASIRDARAVERGLRRAFGARYGHLAAAGRSATAVSR